MAKQWEIDALLAQNYQIGLDGGTQYVSHPMIPFESRYTEKFKQQLAAGKKEREKIEKIALGQARKEIEALKKRYGEQLSQNRTSTALADQITRLISQGTPAAPVNLPGSLGKTGSLTSSNFASRLNNQVSDQQIIDDINTVRKDRLNSLVTAGLARAEDAAKRLSVARSALGGMKTTDAGYKSAKKTVQTLERELQDINSGVAEARTRLTDFRNLSLADAEGASSVTGFRDYLNKPLVSERVSAERSVQDIRDSRDTAVREVADAKTAYDTAKAKYREQDKKLTERNKKLKANLERPPGWFSGDATTDQAARKRLSDELAANTKTLSDLKTGSENALKAYNEAKTNRTSILAGYDERLTAAQNTLNEVTARLSLSESFDPGKSAKDYLAATRESLRLPEERAIDQIGQIDPQTLETSRMLGTSFRDIAASPLAPTTDPRTEEMRGLIEDEAINQLRLGSTLDVDSLRNYQQAARAAQTARGNIFGVAPAVEEAAQTGLAGEQRRLSRYGAAASFLAGGQTRGDARARDIALRDTLQRNRLGAAADFIAAGPSVYNLGTVRNTSQQNAFRDYINANQANPGSFLTQPTQIPFYQTANPNAGFMGAQTAANMYGSLADHSARTYSAQVSALGQVAAANSVPNYISAFSSLVPSFSFGR